MEELSAEGEKINGERNPFEKGSNPAYNTARSKLQKKRRGLNDDIIKELRLRHGAENLLRATNNKGIQSKLNIELNFINSKLEVLKKDLQELNSSVRTYQNENSVNTVPMISLGLKETIDVSFETVFVDYIEEHYCEKGADYLPHIAKLQTLRVATRTPERTDAGVNLLIKYYNTLWYIEKRFYPPGRPVPVYFTWYDALSGVSTSQKTMGFERGSVLFNVAALYSQIGSAQDRTSVAGLTEAIRYYAKCSGLLKFLRDRFNNAPSLDMNKETLTLLMQLILSQAQECVFEKKVLSSPQNPSFKQLITLSRECSTVSDMFDETHKAVSTRPLHSDVPSTWITLTRVKSYHYKSLAHLYIAQALINTPKVDLPSNEEIKKILEDCTNSTNKSQSYFSDNQQQRDQYCRDHLHRCVNLNETAVKDYNLCRYLKEDTFSIILSAISEKASLLLIEVQSDDDFDDILRRAADIIAETDELISMEVPDLKQPEGEDLFKDLGPVSTFSAKHEWTIPRRITLNKDLEQGYGFILKGEQPCVVAEVTKGLAAHMAGVRVGDVLTSVNSVDAKWLTQNKIKSLITEHEATLEIFLSTPMEANNTYISKEALRTSVRSSDSGGSSGRDMKQAGDTMSSTWKKKMNNLTFLKQKKNRLGNTQLR